MGDEKPDVDNTNPKTPAIDPPAIVPTTTVTTQQAAFSGRTLNIPPVDVSRSCSPIRLPAELQLKVKTQYGRLTHLRLIYDTCPAYASESSIEEFAMCLSQAEEIHKAFQREHQYFEAKWPSSQLEHAYFADGIHEQEAAIMLQVRRVLARLKRELTREQPQLRATHDAEHQASFRSKLPDLTLPTFLGEYEKWPPFRELFTSLILEDQRLADVEKLLYLRGCLTGAPAQLISNLILTGDSLRPSWELLTTRYENKRLLVQAHLDQLMGAPALHSRTASGLNTLISTVSEANKALESLGVTANMWDCILVHQVSRKLDRQSREQWETSLGSSNEYPRFNQLEAFITSRARALDRIEGSSAQESGSAKPPKTQKHGLATAHTSSAQTSQSSAPAQHKPLLSASYACDCCKGEHFVVSCPLFRSKTPADRKQLAVEKRLCFNCLGRHNAQACRSTQGCKHCGHRHHTMLHDVAPAPTSSTPPQQSSDTTQPSTPSAQN